MAVEIRVTEAKNGKDPIMGNIYMFKPSGKLYFAVKCYLEGTWAIRLFSFSEGNAWNHDSSWGTAGPDLWENLGKPKISRI